MGEWTGRRIAGAIAAAGILYLAVLGLSTGGYISFPGICACGQGSVEFVQVDSTSSSITVEHDGGTKAYAGNIVIRTDTEGNKGALSELNPAYNETDWVREGEKFTVSGLSPDDSVWIRHTARLDKQDVEESSSELAGPQTS